MFELQTFFPELGWLLGENNSPWPKFHSNPKFQEEIILNSIEF
jgi:hypothetical protein